MARWVRDGDAPDKVPVSFVVTKAAHPELVEWLWTLPFRKQSEVIRNILSEAAKMVASGADLTPPPAAKAVETPGDHSLPRSTAPAPVVAEPSESVPSNPGGMTAATAAILRRQQGDF